MGRLYRYFALASLFFEAEVHCAGAVCHEGLKGGVTALSLLGMFLFRAPFGPPGQAHEDVRKCSRGRSVGAALKRVAHFVPMTFRRDEVWGIRWCPHWVPFPRPSVATPAAPSSLGFIPEACGVPSLM